MFRKNTFSFTPATATAGTSVSFIWKLLLVGFLVITGCVGGMSGGLTPTANAASKPHANTIQVTDCSSTSDGTPSTGNLAYALTHYASGDTIQFACSGGTSGVYTITVPSTININNSLTLDGNGYNVTLDGGNAVEILNVNSGTNFTLNGLTIAHGKAPSNNCYGNSSCGGGIYNSGTLTVTNSSFNSNSTPNNGFGGPSNFRDEEGGAIFNGGTINYISNSSFISNFAYEGGAISNISTINSITNSTFISNSVPNTGQGGAIFNISTINSITNSTFISNSAIGGIGGAILNSVTLNNIVNSTFISNSAGAGGAIYILYQNFNNNITNSTFISNSASDGGTIYNDESIINVTNSIFAKGSGAANCDNQGTFNDGGGNLSDDGTCNFTQASSHKNVTNLNLGTLGYYNGGTTQTIPLLVGSAALFAGVPANCPGFDQNNVARPQPAGTNCDSGAFEANPQLTPNVTAGSNPNPSQVGQSVILTATISGNSVYTPTGTVAFTNTTTNTPLGSSPIDANGNAVITPTFASAGNFNIAVGYTGNLTFTSAITNFTQVVTGVTSITITSAPNPSTVGQTVTFTATVSGNSPTLPSGMITFTNATTNQTLGTATIANGVATITTVFTQTGSYSIKASYGGDGNYTGSSNQVTQTVNKANTSISITSTPNPSSVGQSVTFNATVSPATATGNVTFTLGTANVVATLNSGTATYVTSTLPVGSTVVTATYGGDSSYVGSTSSSVTQVVNAQNQPTNPPTIAANAGNGQSTPISTTFPIRLQSIVRDGNTGQPISGAIVVFQAPSSGASGTFSPTNSTTFTATTDASGLATASAFVANGTVGSYQVIASTSGAASPATFNLVNNPIGTASGYTYYLPFLANAANNFTTYLIFQNTANVSSTVAISFFDSSGNAGSAASGTCSSVAALGECIVPNPFASGKQGQGIIVSQQPLNVIVSEATPYGGSAYAVSAGASNSLIAPVAIKGGLVDFTTQLSIFNGGNSSVAGTVQFFDQNGNHITAADKSFNLAAHSTTIYDQSQDNTLSNFYGWAQVTSPAGSQLVAQTLEQRPSVKFVAIVNAQFNPQTTLYAPAIFNTAFGSFITGANLVNPNSQPVTVSITYYKNDGTASTTTPFVIPGNAVTGIFQGGTSGNGLPSGGLPSGWYGAATVKVTGGSGIVMFVNEQGGLTATGSDQSGTYGAAVSGSSVVGLPVMANGAFGGYITGATIENITNSPVTATVQYYDLNGNTVGTAKTVTIGGNASAALYQGGSDQALPSGFYGTAQITVTGGPSSSLLVTTNAQSNAFFYSYTEPNF